MLFLYRELAARTFDSRCRIKQPLGYMIGNTSPWHFYEVQTYTAFLFKGVGVFKTKPTIRILRGRIAGLEKAHICQFGEPFP